MRSLPRSLDFAAALQLSDYNDARSLAASTAETIYVPDGAKYLLITSKSGGDIWINSAGSTAVVASSDVENGTASQLILPPQLVSVRGITKFSIITESAQIVSLAWFSSPTP